MERLTVRNEENTGYYYPLCFDKCDGMGASRRCDTCVLTDKVCTKLGQYEDTNLTPEQIVEIDRLYREKCEELATYQQLEEDELLLRLP